MFIGRSVCVCMLMQCVFCCICIVCMHVKHIYKDLTHEFLFNSLGYNHHRQYADVQIFPVWRLESSSGCHLCHFDMPLHSLSTSLLVTTKYLKVPLVLSQPLLWISCFSRELWFLLVLNIGNIGFEKSRSMLLVLIAVGVSLLLVLLN